MHGLTAMVTLRPATEADLADAERLLEEVGLTREGFAACVTAGSAIVGRDQDGALRGVVATERFGEDALLRSLAVSPAARGQGLGAALAARALDDARAAGARVGWLLTETADTFFEARGWQPVGRSAAPAAVAASVEFASACAETARAMRRAL